MFRYIKAMSYDKQKIEQDLRASARPLTMHLIKLYLFPSSQYVNHWRQEVRSFLYVVPRLKNSKKFPSFKLIMSNISGYADMCDTLMYTIISDYSSLDPERMDAAELEALLMQYFEWISRKLSQQGSIPAEEIYEELSKLGL